MSAEQTEFLYELRFATRCKEPNKQLQLFEKTRIKLNRLLREKGFPMVSNHREMFETLRTLEMKFYLEGIEKEETLLTERYQLSAVIEPLLVERDAWEEQQRLMGELLKSIRRHETLSDKEKEATYSKLRTFLCQNYLITEEDIEDYIPVEFASDIRKMYHRVNLNEKEVSCCPHCSRPVAMDGSCTDVCNYYQRKHPKPLIRKPIDLDMKWYALVDGIYRFTNLPSIGERYIYQELMNTYYLNSDVSVLMYPGVDAYDVSVTNGRLMIELDIKDYVQPEGLVQHFKTNGYATNKMRSSSTTLKYLVIPNHRVDLYNQDRTHDYMNELKTKLEANGIEMEVIQEETLYHQVKKMLATDEEGAE